MTKIDLLSTTALTPVVYEPYTQHGGKVKRVIRTVAQIVIPFVAAPIAGAIGLSAAIGSTLAGAATGAVLGGASAALTGGDWKKGALMGGLSGGVAGYFNPGTTTTAAGVKVANQPFSGSMFRPGAGYSQTMSTVGSNVTNVGGQLVNANTGVPLTADQITAFNQSGASVIEPGSFISNTGGNIVATSPSGATANLSNIPKVGGSAATDVVTAGFTTQTFNDMKNRILSPENAADVATQMAVNALGATMGVGDPTPEQQQIIEESKARLEELKTQDRAAYDMAIATANRFLTAAKQYDPTYLARQGWMTAMNQAAVQKRDALSNINPANEALRSAEARRFDIAGTQSGASAYDKGTLMGLNTQSQLYNQAAAAYPKSGLTGYDQALTGLRNTYADINKIRSDEKKAFNEMFGAYYSPRKYAGLNLNLGNSGFSLTKNAPAG